MPPADETDFLEMQTLLRADASGDHRGAVEKRLDEAGHAIKRRIDAGVAPAEFSALDALHGATEAAKEIVTTAWSRLHPRNP